MLRDDPANRKKMKALKQHLWLKLLVIYLIPMATIMAGMGFMAYRAARVSMEKQLGQTLISVARIAADVVGKPRALALTPGDEETRTYNNLAQKLSSMIHSSGVESIYMFDDNQAALVDSGRDFAIGENIPKLAASKEELSHVFKGKSFSTLLFTGRDGMLYKTGFAPVSIEGKVVAVVGVDGKPLIFSTWTIHNRHPP